MANVGIVETSLRDGNQCLWGALGVTTANTLTIAPAMERAGYRAIDFTTSTHMGVAVRYKQEDPWERLRAMAEICRTTPLQFLSTGFRFIAWETASPEFMELAFRTLAKNGIRRFALADHIQVRAAGLKDGLLSVELVREIPEAMKPRKIDIAGGADKRSAIGGGKQQPSAQTIDAEAQDA